MINLSMPDMYPATPTMKKEMRYPTIQLPLAIMENKKPTLGDVFEVTLTCEVVGINEDEYSSDVRFQVSEGEVESVEEEAAEKKKGQD